MSLNCLFVTVCYVCVCHFYVCMSLMYVCMCVCPFRPVFPTLLDHYFMLVDEIGSEEVCVCACLRVCVFVCVREEE